MRFVMIVLLALFMNACTMYTIEKQTPEGYIKVDVTSSRSFEQPDLHYVRGDGTEFDFKAANADNNTAAIVGVMGPMIQMMQQLIAAQAAAPVK